MPTAEAETIEPPLTETRLRTYLESCLGAPVRIVAINALGNGDAGGVKRYGYNTPVRVDYERSGQRCSLVLETIAPGRFGHEHMADRAQLLLSSHAAFNRLPLHVRSLDVGGFRKDGELVSVGDIDEFFALNEFVPGTPYYRDLERLRGGGQLLDADVARADALCDYLAAIHRVRGSNPELYERRIRELIGGHECIAGLLDSYPRNCPAIAPETLEAIEQACVNWRWRLKPLTHRLRQVHGDFHPWNVIFRSGVSFAVLDRSRGEWGEPADDVTCLTVNYLFFSLLKSGRMEGAFDTLFTRFWQRYLDATADDDLLCVAAPFFAFRGLVLASPVWYPALAPKVRRSVLAFVRAVLNVSAFDPLSVNDYCDG
jgi:phosphotransferase family enzyme